MTGAALTPETVSGLADPRLRPARDLLAEGRSLARSCRVGRNRFLDAAGVDSEADYKRRAMAAGRIMQHAHIGFRNVDRTCAAIAEVYERCATLGTTVDRFGVTLDWSMGYPQELRAKRPRGTGIVVRGPEDFARIANAAPAAAHFGDFMMGLPGAVENTQAALAAGATAIGNLGQYFTFRLPYWDDDVATTEATVVALGLIAAQGADVLVHSNLDDGFAGLFKDVASALGMVLIEKHIVETLAGATLSHCYGHHFSSPLLRMAFHHALGRVSSTPGTMIFGNTVSYRATPAGNYASLASYLQADIWALRRMPTGHAINPVPVTENERIPDVEDIIDAQLFAARLTEHAGTAQILIDQTQVDVIADHLVEGAQYFACAALAGLADRGIETDDAAALMLAIRRMGPTRLEQLFGPQRSGEPGERSSRALVPADWWTELERDADRWTESLGTAFRERVATAGLTVCVGTTDVHEHGKTLLERVFETLDIRVVDAGVAVDPEALVAAALSGQADLIAISTYNGVALRYADDVLRALREAGAALPVCMGGRLNQIPDDSNTDLPVDVSADLAGRGITVCPSLDAMAAVLDRLAGQATLQSPSPR